MQDITFLNIRVAHQIKDCGKEIMKYLYMGDTFCHTLIVSPPGCGKTTLLRDIVRHISDGSGRHSGQTVGVVDERSEIAACYQGTPFNDLGCRTDVLDQCPKELGMMMMVRSMAPKVLAVDEIGTGKDIQALEYVMNCGVSVLATIHGNSMEQLARKPIVHTLIKERRFKRYILLEPGKVGQIRHIVDERGCVLYQGIFTGEAVG